MAAPIIVVSGPSGAGKTTVSKIVAEAFEPSAHLRMDDFTRVVVRGWVDPSTPEAAHQNRAVGGALAVAAMHLAESGYTVVADGHVFPDAAGELAAACAARGVPLHYAVLRVDAATCVTRAGARAGASVEDTEALVQLHARFADLGRHESHAVDASGPPDAVAAELLAACAAGRLVVVPAG